MSRQKIVFFDIDGTLLGGDGKIRKSTKEALQKLKENNIMVAIATGRAPFMFKHIRRELNIDTFVSFNGQYVVLESEIIFERQLEQKSLMELVQFSKEYGHSLVFMNESHMRANESSQAFIAESLASIDFPYPLIDADFYKHQAIYQTLLFCEEKDEVQYKNCFKQFDFVRWHRLSTDVLPHGGSKALGIKEIINRLGIPIEDIYAFGDGLNDMQMLTEVGTGIAMGNAKRELKRIADYVTDDVDEDGIMKGLKHIGLIK
ncbi:Cof-type HAD-IIB family hydrolase [Calidifontibacillus oryziterrae]|uniref:Cof-type HAD-IIB family hydrolase n=1 Tax=Calidifontibacillus oryziterrae TaxID=1191699 RepID=UPI00030A7076|nr:Cof-type HAD-IIB family hydrolase [Calidifontibacillus oryziterrae]